MIKNYYKHPIRVLSLILFLFAFSNLETVNAQSITINSVSEVNSSSDLPLVAGRYYFEQKLTVNFDIVGTFDNNVYFEAVLKGLDGSNNPVYYNLGNVGSYLSLSNSNTLIGLNHTVDIPTKQALVDAGFNINNVLNNAEIKIVAFTLENSGDEYIASTSNFTQNSYLEVNNGNNSETFNGSTHFFNTSNQTDGVYTKRYGVTDALSTFLNAESVVSNDYLQFNFRINGLTTITSQTIVRFQVSTDGGDSYTDVDTLFNNNTYQVDITQDWFSKAETTHFRWIQNYPEGTWELDLPVIVESNSFNIESALFAVGTIYEEESAYPNGFGNYRVVIGDGPDANNIEEEFKVNVAKTITLEVIDANQTANIWPDDTKFVFHVEGYDADESSDILFEVGSVVDNGELQVTLPDSLFTTDEYTIYVEAQHNDYSYPEYDYENNGYPTSVRTIMVVNQIEADISKLEAETLTDLTLDIQDTVVFHYKQYGTWDSNTKFSVVLEQYDVTNTLLAQQALTKYEELLGDSIAVIMPDYVSKQDGFSYFKLSLAPFIGTAINFGELITMVEKDVDLIKGSTSNMSSMTFDFDQEGDRYLQTTEQDLSTMDSAFVSFTYVANNLPENPTTLPYVEVSTDGVTFEKLKVDHTAAEFGSLGYLPSTANATMELKVPAAYCTSTTVVRFVQDANFEGGDTWKISNISIVDDGKNLVSGYIKTDNDLSQTITFTIPDLTDYKFDLVRDADGFEPVLYSGNSVDITYSIKLDANNNPVGLTYPDETVYSFYLKDYPGTGDTLLLTSGTGSSHNFDLPSDITKGQYSIYVKITKDDFVYEDIFDANNAFVTAIATLDIYNPLLITEVTTKDVVYSGNSISVKGFVESKATAVDASWHYNLVMTDTYGDDWLLAVQQGDAVFIDIAVPAYVNGNTTFEVIATMDKPKGEVGKIIPKVADVVVSAAENLTANNGEMVSYSTASRDLSAVQYILFDVKASDLEVTANQKLVLEYSTDGGVTYVPMKNYPNSEFTLAGIDAQNNVYFEEKVELPEAARVEEGLLRWRVDEYLADFDLQDIKLRNAKDYTIAPIKNLTATSSIAMQRIDIDSLNYSDGCKGGSVDLYYNLKGKFGDANQLTLYVTDSDPEEVAQINTKDVSWIGVTEGTGVLTIDISELDNNLSGSTKFRLKAEDVTLSEMYDHNNYLINITGELSVASAEINLVPVINVNTGINADANTCENIERVATVTGVQDNFVYQLRNYETGELIGSEVELDGTDTDLMDDKTYPYWNSGQTELEINLGFLSEELNVEVLVYSQDEALTLVCDSLVPSTYESFTIAPMAALYYSQYDDANGVYRETKKLVTDGQDFDICEGNNDYEFYYGYYKNGSWNPVTVTWLRDSLEDVGAAVSINNFALSGIYNAQYVTGNDCSNDVSVSFNMVVNQEPEQDTISFAGSLNLCEGEVAQLMASEGYNFYRWNKNGLGALDVYSQTLNVDETGYYQVQVSNMPFSNNCFSVYSDPLEVNIHTFTSINFEDVNNNNTTSEELCDTDSVISLKLETTQNNVTYYLKDEATSDTFAIIAGTGTRVEFITDTLVADMQQFYLEATWNDDPTCSKIVSNNVLKVSKMPEYQIFVSENSNYQANSEYELVEGELTVCEGVHLAIGDEANNVSNTTYSDVTWYKDGYSQTTGSYTRLEDVESGTYIAVYDNGTCEYEIGSVVINSAPEQPELNYTGELNICEDSDLLIATAAGFETYTWYNYNSEIGNSDSTYNVFENGAYTVAVSNALGCMSEESESVEVTFNQLSSISFSNTDIYVCSGDSVAKLEILNTQDDVTYYLIDEATDSVYATIVGTGDDVQFTTDTLVSDMQQFYLEGRWDNDLTCTDIVSTSVLKISKMMEYELYISLDEDYTLNDEYFAPDDTSNFCAGANIAIGVNGEGVSNTTYSNIVWYRDGYSQTSNWYTRLAGVSEGVYTAVFNNGTCEFEIGSVTIEALPKAPEITYDSLLVTCVGEQINLYVPSGYEGYAWFKDGDLVGVSDSVLTTYESGSYSVMVSNGSCYSAMSGSIDVNFLELSEKTFAETDLFLCNDSTVTKVNISGTVQPNVLYQLNDIIADTLIGSPFYMTSYTYELSFLVSSNMQIGITAMYDDLSCMSNVNSNVLSVHVLPSYSLNQYENGGYFAIDDTVCLNSTLSLLSEDNETPDNLDVIWYRNNYPVEVNTAYCELKNAGVYKAKISTSVCQLFTKEVTVEDILTPMLTPTGNLEFCEGEEELVLSASDEFAHYNWFRDGNELSNIASLDGGLTVSLSGIYTVVGQTEKGCNSRFSLPIEVEIHTKPTLPTEGIGIVSYTVLEPVLCGSALTGVIINDAESNVVYQLINYETGAILSNQAIGVSGLVLMTNDSVESTIDMAIQAERIDVEACVTTSLPFTVKAYDLSLKVYGNMLVAVIPDADIESYQWFRSGFMVTNGGDQASLTVFDNAEYSVVVTTVDGCILESVLEIGTTQTKSTTITSSLHPNPVVDFITLTLNNAADNIQVRIYDATGYVLYANDYTISGDEEKTEKRIDIQNLDAGFYTIEIVGSNFKEVKNFIKN